MILFIDDEKWIIQGILDYYENKANKNLIYTPKHEFYPVEALKLIKENKGAVDLIVTDISMDFGDYDFDNPLSGGVQFINTLRALEDIKPIPIIIYSIHNKSFFESDLNYKIDDKLLFHVYRNEDADNDILNKLIEGILQNLN